MIDQKTYQNFKKVISDLEKKREQSIGKLSELKKTLKDEFGCKDIKSAQRLYRKLKQQEKLYEKQFTEAYNKFLKQLQPALDSLVEDYPEISDQISASLARSVTGKERNKTVKGRN